MPDQLAIRYTDRRDLSVTVGPETIAVGRPPSAIRHPPSAIRHPPSKIGQRYFDDKRLAFLRFSPRAPKLCNPAQCFQTVSALGRMYRPRGQKCP